MKSPSPEERTRLHAEWNARLEAEGLPPELPPDLAEYFEDADTASQAARAYAQSRMHESSARGFDSTGEHARMAQAMAAQFGLTEAEAMSIVEAEFDRADRLGRRQSAA